MLCRITDEYVQNPWEQDMTEEEMDRRQMMEEEGIFYSDNFDDYDDTQEN